jgi:hypothetical protein
MGNLDLYERFRDVPQEAQKKIQGGRLNGKTDINPMWRIKKLTEEFGPVGIGWYPKIIEKWLEKGECGEVVANIRIHLFVKVDGEWSMPIEGVGGSMFVTKEKNGFYTDDDAYKKAYTDAISVAGKSLGLGANIYWDKDPTKYSKREDDSNGIETGRKPKNEQKTDDKPQSVKPITRSELIGVYGLENPENTIAWLEGKVGKELANFDADETAKAREILDKKKQERDAEKRVNSTLSKINDEDLPFSVRG